MNDGISFLPCLEQEESTCPGRTRIPSSILQLSFPLSIGRVSRAPVLLAQMHIQTQKAHVLVSLIRSCHHNAASVTSKFPKRDVCSDSRLLKASQQPFLVACARRLLFFFFFFALSLFWANEHFLHFEAVPWSLPTVRCPHVQSFVRSCAVFTFTRLTTCP